MRKTKIVCTLGPATDSTDTIKALIEAGMATARVNFSHGSYESHSEMIGKLKQAREELHAPVALLLDTKGPEIRTKTLKESKVYLERGHSFMLTTRDIEGDINGVSVTYENLAEDVAVGTRILIDDGLIELRVTKISGPDIICFVENGGFLSDRKGINIPDVFVNLPALTEKDVDDILFGIQNDFDFIAASFIRKASDVVKIRRVLEENGGSHLQIIAKIENRDGVNNIDEIISVADGIMVARGDLGVEIPPEEVPIVQKLLIKKANGAGKPVITATQMLESMNTNPRPTRAEANDVANAILDGTDCVMLSGETAKGQYPIESVRMMARIAEKAETAIDYTKNIRRESFLKNSITNSISHAACTASNELKASCIATVTNSGFTARMVSKFRPSCPIVACALMPSVWRQLNLIWGVKSMLLQDKKPINDETVFALAIEKSLEAEIVKDGDIIVLVAGTPVGATGATNTLKVEMVGNVLAKGKGVGKGKVSGKSCIVNVFDEIDKYFKHGDILVTPETTNDWIPYIKKASGLVVGPLEDMDSSCHAEIVSAALEIPVIICNTKVIEAIPNDTMVTLDLDSGLVFNGDKRD